MILGCDISTSCVGVCLLDLNGDLIFLNHLDIGDYDVWSSADIFYDYIDDLKSYYNIEHIFIEEAKKSFANKKSSSDVLSKLTRFNAICSYIIYSLLLKTPIFLNESSARKKCGVKVKKNKLFGPQKKQVFEQLIKKAPLNTYPWEFKRTGNVKDYCLDMCDAYVVARAGYLLHVKK